MAKTQRLPYTQAVSELDSQARLFIAAIQTNNVKSMLDIHLRVCSLMGDVLGDEEAAAKRNGSVTVTDNPERKESPDASPQPTTA